MKYNVRYIASAMRTNSVLTPSKVRYISSNYSGGLSMTSFFNTNLSNLSNFAERLPEGTIRFVLCTNLANDSNAMRTANLVSIRVIRGGKKLTHSIELDKFVRFVFKIIRNYSGRFSLKGCTSLIINNMKIALANGSVKAA